ncbi:MAG: hypothetical protein MZV64_62635 [Ignavibacteriales bacterium]|nr:hypothetical protein [Ignavibacteriales bacterium]
MTIGRWTIEGKSILRFFFRRSAHGYVNTTPRNGSFFFPVMTSYACAACSMGKRCVMSGLTFNFPLAIRSSTDSKLRPSVQRT